MNDVMFRDVFFEFSKGAEHGVLFCDEYLKKNGFYQRTDEGSCCSFSWSSPTLVVLCEDCALNKYSYLCLDCFNKGDHNGHRVSTVVSQSGFCSCGRHSYLKYSSFCPIHRAENHKNEEQQYDNNIYNMFLAVLDQVYSLMIYSSYKFDLLVEWIVKSSKNRVICYNMARAFFDKGIFKSLLYRFTSIPISSISSVRQLLATVISDSSYKLQTIPCAFSWLKSLLYFNYRYIANSRSNNVSTNSILKSFYDHFVQLTSYSWQISLMLKGFDWVSDFVSIIQTVINYSSIDWSFSLYSKIEYDMIFTTMKRFLSIIKHSQDNSFANNEFSEKISKLLFRIEGCLSVSRVLGEKANDMYKNHSTIGSICSNISNLLWIYPYNNSDLFCILNAFQLFIHHIYEEDRFDSASSELFMYRCVLKPDVNVSVSLLLHIMLSNSMRANFQSSTVFQQFDSQNYMLNEYMCVYSSLLPFRFFAVSYFSSFSLFVRNSEDFLKSVSMVCTKKNIIYQFLPLFSLIQIILGITKSKDLMIASMGKIFGIYEVFDSEESKLIDFSFIHFFICLLYDRACLNNNKQEMALKYLKNQILSNPVPLSSIEEQLWPSLTKNKSFMENLLSFSRIDTSDNDAMITMADDMKWNPFVPWLPSKIVLDAISCFITKYKRLIPFPSFEDLPKGLDFSPVFSCPIILAFLYRILSDYIFSPEFVLNETLHIVLCFIPEICKFLRNEYCMDSNVSRLIAENFDELINCIPCNRDTYLFTPIQYKNREPHSIVSLLSLVKDFGNRVLILLNVPIHKNTQEPEILRDKTPIKNMKKRILEMFREEHKKFGLCGIYEDQNDACCVCFDEESEVLGFPILNYRSFLPSFVQFKLNYQENYSPQSTITFRLCQHIMHPKCKPNEETFLCPIDRSKRNGLLPKIDHFKWEKLSNDNMDFVRGFIESVFSTNTYESCIDSLSGHMILSEIRYRLKPDFIDQGSFSSLSSNLFLVIWHYFQLNNALDTYNHSDPIHILIHRLVISNDPVSIFVETIQEISKNLVSLNKYEFLRRASFVQHFYLGIKFVSNASFIDWDYYLSPESISKRYHIGIEYDEPLPTFGLVPLADTFVGLQSPPYSINIKDQGTNNSALCLLSGEIIRLSSGSNRTISHISDHLRNKTAETFEPYMVISGSYATSVFIANASTGRTIASLPLYVDQYGRSDIGLKNQSFLYLSQERVLKLIDSLMSGSWIDED